MQQPLTPRSKWNLLPTADGKVKLSGRDQVLRTSTLIRDSPERGEEQGNLLTKSVDPLQPHFETHRGMMVKLEMISGPSQAI